MHYANCCTSVILTDVVKMAFSVMRLLAAGINAQSMF